MRDSDRSSKRGHPPRPPDAPDGALLKSGLVALRPSEQATVVNRVVEAEESKTEGDANSTPNPDSRVVLPMAWSPEETARRLEVRLEQEEEEAATEEMMKRLYKIARRDYPLHEETALRQMSVEESEALTAYVERHHTRTSERAAIMAYHQIHVEGVLIADVSARIRLGKSISRRSLLRELAECKTRTDATKEVMRQFIRAAQQVVLTISTRSHSHLCRRERRISGRTRSLNSGTPLSSCKGLKIPFQVPGQPHEWPGTTPCEYYEQKVWIRFYCAQFSVKSRAKIFWIFDTLE